jgi:FAD/FMN-containing dehydrogenase
MGRRAHPLAPNTSPRVDAPRPSSAAELAAIIRDAGVARRQVAVVGHCHHGAITEPSDHTLTVSTSRLQNVETDLATRRVRVEAGVLCRDLQATVGRHGVTFLGGSSPDLEAVEYTVAGGAGWLRRRFGLTCNTVTAAQVVTADGTILHVDADNQPELFWALRGGNDIFAAVVSLELRLFAIPNLYAGRLLWPIERAAEVLHCWRVWTAEVPDTITSSLRLLPHLATTENDGHQRGARRIAVDAVITENEDDADIWLRPLRALRPTVDTMTPRSGMYLSELSRPNWAGPVISDHRTLGTLPEDAIDTLLELAGPGATAPLLAIHLRHLGGATARSAPDHGALDRIDAGYALRTDGATRASGPSQAISQAIAGLWSALSSVPAAGLRDTAASTDNTARARRLEAVKSTYDPEGRFVAAHHGGAWLAAATG